MAASQPPEQLTSDLWRVLHQIIQNPEEIIAENPGLARQLVLDARRMSAEEFKP